MSKIGNLSRQLGSNLRLNKVGTKAKRDLILSILRSTLTKREAKNYLTKYQGQFSNGTFPKDKEDTRLTDVNRQREIFIDRYLRGDNPFINIYNDEQKISKVPLRIAIFKISFLEITSDQWTGISETFDRLKSFGISPIIVLDFDHLHSNSFAYNELYIQKNTNKIISSINELNRSIIGNLEIKELWGLFERDSDSHKVQIFSLKQVLIPMYQGIIPIVQPVVYNKMNSYQQIISSRQVMSCLIESLLTTTNLLTIEKIVMIDPIGGIPSVERNKTSHVYVNLSQEYSDIVSELYIGFIKPQLRDKHKRNLDTINSLLSLISSKTGNNEATGIITTPSIASINEDSLNPVIYNVLTDRPIISSSLPANLKGIPQLSTSIIKKGTDVQIFDRDNFCKEFTFENLVREGMLNKEKLVNLINDSFGRTLDVDKYIKRINGSLACIIIAGNYDGAAIITWEKSDGQDYVAYLDKFAISKANQGVPGLADVIFKAMLQIFPAELIWRSRRNNPVNKWYFERSLGSLASPSSNWKLFFTGKIFKKSYKHPSTSFQSQNKFKIDSKILDYMKIIENIPPSFKD